MIEQLTGKDAKSARRLARDTGISQETLSRWLREARSLPVMPKRPATSGASRSIDDKIRILSAASKLSGSDLSAFLEAEGIGLADLEQWRLALDEEGRSSKATTKRIRKLERELARKEKALAEAAALLVLKKKVDHLYQDQEDGDEDTDGENER